MEKQVFFSIIAILIAFLFGGFVFGSMFNLEPILMAEKENGFSRQNLFAEPIKNFVRESPKMSFIQGNSLLGITPPASVTPQVLGSILGGVEIDERALGVESENGIIEYIVEPGDTLSSIATKYNISLETILWTNDLNSKSLIKLGQKLIISPVSGVIYYVKKGDVLSELVEIYKGKVEEIIAFNNLSDKGDIFIGDILIIPGGKMPPKPKPISQVQIPLGSSYFICPLTACRITQGLHWYNAIDFGGKCGDPIYATASGTVQVVRYGWNGGLGNYLNILHPNNAVTVYGHIQTSLVVTGQTVSQGESIAIVGGKPGMPGAGRSTGCHVHFEVRGARNPFAK